MVFYIFVIAMFNLGLGFAVTVYLARVSHEGPQEDDNAHWLADGSEKGLSSGEASPETPVGTMSQPAEHEPQGPADDTLDEPPDESVVESTAACDEESSPDSPDPPPTETGNRGAVEEFQDSVREYQKQLADVDEQLHRCEESADAEQVEACLDSLVSANDKYLSACDDVGDAFEQLPAEFQGLENACENIRKAVKDQGTQIAETNADAQNFDYDADLPEGCRRMADRTAGLLEANRQLQDTLDEVISEAARRENENESDDESLIDPLTGLLSREAIEAHLADLLSDAPNRETPFSAAFVDLDDFAGFNQRFGHNASDRLLLAIGKLLAVETRDRATAGRFSGEQFLLLFNGGDVRSATTLVEHVRQSIASSLLQFNNEDARITASCAVTEMSPDDTQQSLLDRMNSALEEAKRYGHNRTFLHEGKFPTPVVPPNFSLEDHVLTL